MQLDKETESNFDRISTEELKRFQGSTLRTNDIALFSNAYFLAFLQNQCLEFSFS